MGVVRDPNDLASESRVESSFGVGLMSRTRARGPVDEFRGALNSFPLAKGSARKDVKRCGCSGGDQTPVA